MIDYNSRKDVKDRASRYRITNRKKLLEKEKIWRKKNPEKAKKIDKRKNKKRIQNPLVKIRCNVSRGIGLALRRCGGSKAGESIMKYLEFSVDDLKHHLENLFEPWMNWTNYGKYTAEWNDNDQKTWTWQIDHIIPVSEFKYDSMSHPEFKKCWKLLNLRPYSSRDNCLDGCNRTRHIRK
jgi:hypothetical protein